MNNPGDAVSALGAMGRAGAMGAIGLYARHKPGFEERLARSVAILRRAVAEHPGTIVQSTSLGVEGMVVTDLIARHGLDVPVATLQTGKLHAQTLALIPRIEERYGVTVEQYMPRDESVVHFVRKNGPEAMYQSLALRKSCCEIRKVEPLSRMLAGRTAWITGMRRDQSQHRGAVSEIEQDGNGRTKFNPLADWSWNDIWHYIATYQVPYNELHDEFFPSIGCAPCTRAVSLGEDFRAGRWWWEDESLKECGINVREEPEAIEGRHVPAAAAAASAVSPTAESCAG